jgi:hypothetical protein
MKGAVDVLDYVNHLEVWNHARLMTTLESNPITSQDEKKLNDVLSASQSSWGADWKNKEGQVQGKEREFGVHRRAHRDLRSHPSHTIRGTRTDSAERARVA